MKKLNIFEKNYNKETYQITKIKMKTANIK